MKVRLIISMILALLCYATSIAEVSIIKNPNENCVNILFAYKNAPENEIWKKYGNNINRIYLNENGDLQFDSQPSFDINPATSYPEVVWSKFDGNDYEIAYAYFDGFTWSDVEILTNNNFDELDPDIAFSEEGTVKVTWWSNEPTPQVYYKIRMSNNSWSSTLRVSNPSASNTYPSIAPLSESSLIAYEYNPSSYKRIVVGDIQDGPDPIPTGDFLIGDSNFGPNSEPIPNLENGHLWVDWIYDDYYIAWSEKIGDQWTVQQYEPYTSLDDIPRARLYIKIKVLNGQ